MVQKPTAYTWNSIISAHVQLGKGKEALGLHRKMEQAGVTTDIVTCLCLLKACADVGALVEGRRAHDQIIRLSLDTSACCNSLIDMYAKCGSQEDALHIFDGLSNKSIVSYGALMAGYVESGDAHLSFGLYARMKESGVKPNRAIFLCIIKACIYVVDILQGTLVHHEVIMHGLDSELMLGNALMDLYFKFFLVADALRMFDMLPCPDVISWDIRIAGLAENRQAFSALDTYKKMQSKGLKPDRYTYSCILKACAGEAVVRQGRLVHDEILRRGLDSNVVVSNTLIGMYGSCGYIGEACKVFDGLESRDVVSWGAVIECCVQNGFDGLALDIFESIMHQDALSPNKSVFLCTLKACAMAGTLVLGRWLHDRMIRVGLEIDLMIGSTLLNMYGTLGSVEEGHNIFDSMKDRNEVTWGLMVAGYIQHNHFLPAVKLFIKMQNAGIYPDKTSFVTMLKGCGKAGAIIDGRLLHGQIIESTIVGDAEVMIALVDMYAKCGNSKDSLKLVEGLTGGRVKGWGTQIPMSAHMGCLGAAIDIMDRQGFKPDRVVLLSLLSACTGAGLLEEGRQLFVSMRHECGIEPGIEEYNALVDLLGRAGLTKEAEDLLLSMPSASDVLGWMSLLSCCRSSFDVELARKCFDRIVQLDPTDGSAYTLMLSIYANARMWDNASALKEQLREADLFKTWGAVEVVEERSSFV